MILRAVLFVVVMAGVAGADLTPATEFAACPRLLAGLGSRALPRAPRATTGTRATGSVGTLARSGLGVGPS